MTVVKRIGISVAALIAISSAVEVGEHLFLKGEPGLVSTAEAVVGRPLTPVSVAGVARRSARR